MQLQEIWESIYCWRAEVSFVTFAIWVLFQMCMKGIWFKRSHCVQPCRSIDTFFLNPREDYLTDKTTAAGLTNICNIRQDESKPPGCGNKLVLVIFTLLVLLQYILYIVLLFYPLIIIKEIWVFLFPFFNLYPGGDVFATVYLPVWLFLLLCSTFSKITHNGF